MVMPPEERRRLIRLARESILGGLDRSAPAQPPDLAELPISFSVPTAAFVTLTRQGSLRGCRGSLTAERPLGHEVWRKAWASAFDDPRFQPLARGELDDLDVEIALLSALEPVAASRRAELARQLEPRRHGLLIDIDGHHATFLPKVWESLPDSSAFLRELRAKAGVAPDGWSPATRAWRYTTETIADDSRAA